MLGFLVLGNLSNPSTKNYYVVDFVGGFPAGSSGGGRPQSPSTSLETVPAANQTPPVKTVAINPREDILIKSRKKPPKNQKEIISTDVIPSAPIPSAKQAKQATSGTDGSDIPGTVPGTGSASGADSGIGIGFGSGGVGGGAGNFPYVWYVHAVRKKMDANWNVTSGFSEKIVAQVAFTIARNGTVKDVEVEESSKNDVFDRAAIRAVEYCNPLPPLPQGFQESELRVHVRFTVKK